MPESRTIERPVRKRRLPARARNPQDHRRISDQPRDDLVLRFAKAVAEPGEPVHLLEEDNTSVSCPDLGTAVKSGRPFFVRHQTDLVVIDMDDPDALPALEEMHALC